MWIKVQLFVENCSGDIGYTELAGLGCKGSFKVNMTDTAMVCLSVEMGFRIACYMLDLIIWCNRCDSVT